MKVKNALIILLFVLVSIACTVTRVSPTAVPVSIATPTSIPVSESSTPTPTSTQKGGFMDTTILGAIIGAVATILGAFISRTYADNQISHTKSSTEIKPLVLQRKVESEKTG